MRIVKIQRVVQSARILPIHVKEGDIRGKSTSFYIIVSGRPRSRELRDLVSFQLDKTGLFSTPILPMHFKEGDIRGKSTRFYILVSGRPRSRSDIAHLHMRIVEIKRVGQSARILPRPIHVKRGSQTRKFNEFFSFS